MEIVTAILSPVAEHLILPVARQIGYLFCYRRNIRSLEEESNKLEGIRSGVQQRAEAARRNLQVISPHVEDWLTSIDTTTADVQLRAKKIIMEVTRLQNEGDKHVVFCNTVQDVEPRNSVKKFHSRKQEEEVLAALRDERVTTVGICGMGGVGKKHWLRKGVSLKLEGDDLLESGDELRSRLMQKGSRVLVILDNVWKKVDLKRVGIPSGSDHNYWCKVALTARLRDVCDDMEAKKIVDVEILSEKEAWILFRQKSSNSTDDSSLPEVAKDVAKEFKRLPLAIVTVAGAIKGKTKPSWEDALVELQKAAP
ncbi:hypothetical protein CQW23_25060 [Capsicum baccatum]|uniref:NB-ARC domain-containing protein n=1 Tax=Capsicum baccatum TaxID=33114 RepID=A0A2G2VWK0_CAPBA|nr:hypothetical protein CQW23_25060 [Capsicum baccatum]